MTGRTARVTLALIAALLLGGLCRDWPSVAYAQRTPVKATLQAAATANGNGTPMEVAGLRFKTCTVEIAATTATVQFQCSIDDGVSYNDVAGGDVDETDGCDAAPSQCLLDIPVTCSHLRAPISNCASCTNITVKCMAEE